MSEKNSSHLSAIIQLLQKHKQVFQITTSPNEKWIAFGGGEKKTQLGQAYVWNVGQTHPVSLKIQKERISEFQWSPNSETVLNGGTSPKRTGYVVTVEHREVSDSFTLRKDKTFPADPRTKKKAASCGGHFLSPAFLFQ